MRSTYKIFHLIRFSAWVLIFLSIICFLIYISNSNHTKDQNSPSLFNYINEKRLKNDVIFGDIDNYTDTHCPVTNLFVTYECLKRVEDYTMVKQDIEQQPYARRPFLYHTYWEITNPQHFRFMNLLIMSYLATQDLARSKLIIWSIKPMDEMTQNKYRSFQNSLEFRQLDFLQLCSSGVYKKFIHACKTPRISTDSSLFSDFIRFLVLYNFGGIYFDGDMIMLKSLKPLWNTNFVYRWSFKDDINTAVLGIDRVSKPVIEKFYETLLSNSLTNNDIYVTFYPSNVAATLKTMNQGRLWDNSYLKVYHSALFDGSWLCHDGFLNRTDPSQLCGFDDIYKLNVNSADFSLDKLYKGSFTIHLHLSHCSTCTITETSYFYNIELYFKNKLGAQLQL